MRETSSFRTAAQGWKDRSSKGSRQLPGCGYLHQRAGRRALVGAFGHRKAAFRLQERRRRAGGHAVQPHQRGAGTFTAPGQGRLR